jgi:putative ABC transport system substrate-binding protein
MRKIVTFVALDVLLVTLSFAAYAQQVTKVPRIGRLGASSFSSDSARIESFRQGLRDLGYVEGKNIVIEYRYAEGKLDRLPMLMPELVRLNVDVIVSGGASTTRLAREATATIPIVMSQDPDPVGSGFVASLARPGGNITGLSSLTADLSGKRLELLKEILPKFSRVAVFETSTNTGNAQQLREAALAAGELGIKLQHLDIIGPKDIETAFRAASKGRADAVLVLRGPVLASPNTGYRTCSKKPASSDLFFY